MSSLSGTSMAAEATARWADLAVEFARWGDAGRVATLWWRDDDAADAGAELDRLLAIAPDVPLALAVIPAAAGPDLAARLAAAPAAGIAALQHGWRHANHGGSGRKSEFPENRPVEAIAADLAAGHARLAALFGGRALAVLAPPWNRFAPCHLALLAASGIAAISQLGPRRNPSPAPGVFAANVHVDLVAWRQGRRFIGEAAALGAILEHLRARRMGRVDADEPTGIMSHHLVHDRQTEDFLARLAEVANAHPAARWLGAAQVFSAAAT